MGPGALRRNGALFRGQRNFWDVADNISAEELLGLRCSVAADIRQRCSERRSALACRAVVGVFDPGQARFTPGGPAESWLPRLSAARGDRAAVASSSCCLFMTTP